MDLLLICRDGLENSLLENLVLAMEAKKSGTEVGVLFTQEALAIVSLINAPAWSPGLTGQIVRQQMSANATAMELPTKGGKGEGKRIDALPLVSAASEAGVKMFASPIWVGILGLHDKLPQGIAEIDQATTIKMVSEAKAVIGTL